MSIISVPSNYLDAIINSYSWCTIITTIQYNEYDLQPIDQQEIIELPWYSILENMMHNQLTKQKKIWELS